MGDGLMDFSERCRLCIEPKRLSIDIFSEEGRRIKLKSKINKNLPLKVSQSDGLPSQICYQCLFRLETWVSFKQLCMERDQVMKTWSQSYLDEACGTFNGAKHSKSVALKDSISSRVASVHPVARGEETTNNGSSNQMDDAKSDTSVWEVVKMDDTDTLDCEILEKNNPTSHADNVNPSICCNTQEDTNDDTNDDKHDWNRRKARKPNKVASSESEVSNTHDMDVSGSEFLSESLDSSLVHNLSLYKQSPRQQELSSSEKSPPLLKRKRGRPSKAFLQRERELKKIKDQEKPSISIATSLQGDEMNHNTKVEKGEGIVREELELVRVRPRPATPEFTPIERDDGSGITEVVLDDPEFGSMKFTLSVIDIESPTSSPIPTDTYKYNYACSNVNLSTDSLHREDFEGFESPCSSSFMKSLKDDCLSPYNEMPRSRSQADVRINDSDESLSPSVKRKRSSSASGDFRANSLTSEDLADSDQEDKTLENNGATSPALIEKKHLSKSLENISDLNSLVKNVSKVSEDRNAYSDGELSESPNKKIRRKSFCPKVSEVVTVLQ